MVGNLEHEVKLSVDTNPGDTVAVAKAKVTEITQVPADKQRLIIKGKERKSDEKLDGLGLKENEKCMLMFVAGYTPPAPPSSEAAGTGVTSAAPESSGGYPAPSSSSLDATAKKDEDEMLCQWYNKSNGDLFHSGPSAGLERE